MPNQGESKPLRFKRIGTGHVRRAAGASEVVNPGSMPALCDRQTCGSGIAQGLAGSEGYDVPAWHQTYWAQGRPIRDGSRPTQRRLPPISAPRPGGNARRARRRPRSSRRASVGFARHLKLVRVDEIAQRHTERQGKRRSVVDRNVNRRALNATHIRARHPSLVRQRFLSHVSQPTRAAQISGKRLSGGRNWRLLRHRSSIVYEGVVLHLI